MLEAMIATITQGQNVEVDMIDDSKRSLLKEPFILTLDSRPTYRGEQQAAAALDDFEKICLRLILIGRMEDVHAFVQASRSGFC